MAAIRAHISLRTAAKLLAIPLAFAAAFVLATPLFQVHHGNRLSVEAGPAPSSFFPATFDIWYGNDQTFGQAGRPQAWANVLGNVQDVYGLRSLSYSLNNGPDVPLTIGPNGTRLQTQGDFNAELDWNALAVGANQVRLRATDAFGEQTTHLVTVNIADTTHTSPAAVTVDWSHAGSIQDVAQVVDGRWAIQPDGTVRTRQVGYDRLLAIGDAATWKNYDVTTNVTLHSQNPGGAVGIVAGWQGHTTDQYGADLPDQPRTGHPFPAFFGYGVASDGVSRLDIFSNDNTPSDHEQFLAIDDSGTALTPGRSYTFKAEVTENDASSSHFKFKVWPTGTAEPAAWLLQADGAHSQGSILLAAHQTDASFGTTTITPPQ